MKLKGKAKPIIDYMGCKCYI